MPLFGASDELAFGRSIVPLGQDALKGFRLPHFHETWSWTRSPVVYPIAASVECATV